jgi:o-succinylbenzoate---CoA ligase
MQGYDDNPDATAKTLRNGVLYTGDMGFFDAKNNLHIVQRRSDLIVSGGENVYPAEVEAVLRQHPAIKEACVVGAQHAEWGQQVAAAIVLQPDATVSEQEIISVIRRKLAGYKLPRRFLFVDALPQTASGKIARRAVQELFNHEGTKKREEKL